MAYGLEIYGLVLQMQILRFFFDVAGDMSAASTSSALRLRANGVPFLGEPFLTYFYKNITILIDETVFRHRI